MKIWLSKWVTGFMGTSSHLQKTLYQKHDSCPRCQAKETNNHVIQCSSDSANLIWISELTGFKDNMITRKCDPILIQIVTDFIATWRSGHIFPSILPYAWKYQSLISQQSGLGWGHMFHGIISKQWASLQAEHLEGLHSKLSPYKWMALFQHALHPILHQAIGYQ